MPPQNPRHEAISMECNAGMLLDGVDPATLARAFDVAKALASSVVTTHNESPTGCGLSLPLP
jgi:hypothetical protein